MGLTAAWSAAWLERREHPVLLGPGGTAVSGEAFEALTAEAAGRLAAAGVASGDRVMLSCPPSADTVIAYVAILRLGAVVVPANTAYTPVELQHIVSAAAPVAAVVDEPARLRGLDGAPGIVATPALDGLPSPRDVDLDGAPDAAPALIGFTSGTTGRPKGAILSHGNLLAGARSVVEAWEWTPDDRLICALPLFHMHGLGVAVNGTLAAGASIIVRPGFDPADVTHLAADPGAGASLLFGVPTMWSRLAGSGRLGDLRRLRLLVSGSAPLDPALFESIRDGTGQAPLERYGMTETVMLTGNPLRGQRRPGSVGPPMPGVEVRLSDQGGVEVRGPNVFDGYLDRPDATAEAFTPDGWFRTGDIGELSEDGYLTLVGRASELIISGGYNVYPREVEDALLAHPRVADAAVVGTPDPEWGEIVTAHVVLRDGSATDDIAASLAGSIASYKRPRIWRVVDEIPRNAMGKVLRGLLRE